MIQAILFDMNGVIIDDEHLHELAFKQTLEAFDISLSHRNYIKCCAGKTDKAGYQSISANFNITLPIDSLLTKKNQVYLDLLPANKKSFPGVIDLIKNLSKIYRLAVTSSSSRTEVERITTEFEIIDYFEVMITANEVLRGKPDPEPYLLTATLLNLKPQDCVVIEDSRSGVAAAKAAGCLCIAVTTTHSAEELKEADTIVQDFKAITPELLEALMG